MIYERVFANEIRQLLRKCNAELLPVVGNKMQPAAWPDLYVAHIFYNGWVEFKAENTILRPDQIAKIRKLKERDVPVFVIRAPDRIEDEDGNLLENFDTNSGIDLILKMASIWKDTVR